MMRSFPIFNTGEGFKRLNRKLEWVKKTYPSEEIIFAIEPSSHYWFPLFYFFKKRGYNIVLVPGLFVNRSRELEDNTTRKDDPKDAHIIGELASRGKYCYERQPEGVYAELRHLSDSWLDLSEDKANIRLKIRSILENRFPEFIEIFSDYLGTTARYLLKRCPFPVDLLHDDFDELCQQVFEKSRAKLNSSTVIKLQQAAKSSIGFTEGITVARIQL
jgi:transposase